MAILLYSVTMSIGLNEVEMDSMQQFKYKVSIDANQSCETQNMYIKWKATNNNNSMDNMNWLWTGGVWPILSYIHILKFNLF